MKGGPVRTYQSNSQPSEGGTSDKAVRTLSPKRSRLSLKPVSGAGNRRSVAGHNEVGVGDKMK